jgi:hypothetical protein
MAERIASQSSVDSLSRSQSSVSLQSNVTMESRRSSMDTLFSSTHSRRGRGLMNKIGTGFQTMVHRFSRTKKPLTEMEMNILSTITHFDRDEIIQW